MGKEDKLQESCVKWFKLVHKNVLIHHSPNGGSRNLYEAVKFKRMGVMAGFPDIMICKATPVYHGLFIELKTDKGRTTKIQEIVHNTLRKEGYAVEVCRNIDQFVKIVNGYMLWSQTHREGLYASK